MCLPFAYYRLLVEFPNNNIMCHNSDEIDHIAFIIFDHEVTVDEILLIYKISISYIIPLSTIIICYVLMFIKLNQRSKVMYRKRTQKSGQFFFLNEKAVHISGSLEFKLIFYILYTGTKTRGTRSEKKAKSISNDWCSFNSIWSMLG